MLAACFALWNIMKYHLKASGRWHAAVEASFVKHLVSVNCHLYKCYLSQQVTLQFKFKWKLATSCLLLCRGRGDLVSTSLFPPQHCCNSFTPGMMISISGKNAKLPGYMDYLHLSTADVAILKGSWSVLEEHVTRVGVEFFLDLMFNHEEIRLGTALTNHCRPGYFC